MVFFHVGSIHKDMWINSLKVLIGIRKSHFGSKRFGRSYERISTQGFKANASVVVSEHIKSSFLSLAKEGRTFLSYATEKKR
jgi:hypothetical protein